MDQQGFKQAFPVGFCNKKFTKINFRGKFPNDFKTVFIMGHFYPQ